MDTLDRIEELCNQGDMDTALSMLENLYGQTLSSSDRGRAMALHVLCLEALDKPDDAQELIIEVMKEEGDDHPFILAAGMTFSNFDAFLHAETFLENLCELEPKSSLPWYNLAITLGREGRYPESIAAYQKVVEINPEFTEALYQKAYCMRMMEDWDGAALVYDEYLTAAPDDGDAWLEWAIMESNRGNPEEAYTAFEKAAVHGDPIDVYHNWGVAALRYDDAEKIELCIDKLQDLSPTGWRTLALRADWEESQGNVYPAWEVLQEAFETVLDDENADIESQEYIIVTALRFAKRNHLENEASACVDRIFDDALFTEDTLMALQVLQGEASNAIASYQVTLRCKHEKSGSDDYWYMVYGVQAETPESAEDFASAFEARCTPLTWEMMAIHQLSEPNEGLKGVYWRSDLLTAPPGS
jgi:tetratricopeptide (TPR) repeat protein